MSGYTVGLPFEKVSLSPSKAVNPRTGKANKTAPLKGIWLEMADRIGRDPDIDKSISYQNIWLVGSPKDDVVRKVSQEIEQVSKIRREAGKRGIRKDSVCCITYIVKPSIDFMMTLKEKEQIEFLKISHQVMKDLIHEMYPKYEIIECVIHKDEICMHSHGLVLIKTIDEDGLPNFKAKNEINTEFFDHINANYAARMRLKGYNISDAKMFANLSEEEKMERLQNPREHIDSVLFKIQKQKETEQNLERLERKLEKTIIEEKKAPDLQSYKTLQQENTLLKQEVSLKDKIIKSLKRDREVLLSRIDEYKLRFTEMANKLGSRIMNILGFKEQIQAKNEFPIPEITNGLHSLKDDVKQIDLSSCRIIPDYKKDGQYQIVYRNQNGKYETVKSGFVSRRDAERYIRQIQDVQMSLELKQKMDSGKRLRRK